MRIFIGNLAHDVTEDDLRLAVEPFGQVNSVTSMTDKVTGESRGFGFVEVPSKAEGESVMTGLNGKELKGQALNVNEARPQTESRGGKGREGGSGFGGRGGRNENSGFGGRAGGSNTGGMGGGKRSSKIKV